MFFTKTQNLVGFWQQARLQANVFRQNIEDKAENYPQLWISLVLLAQHVVIDDIHRTMNRDEALMAKFFVIGTFFLLTS
jgi:hypothetical protein